MFYYWGEGVWVQRMGLQAEGSNINLSVIFVK